MQEAGEDGGAEATWVSEKNGCFRESSRVGTSVSSLVCNVSMCERTSRGVAHKEGVFLKDLEAGPPWGSQ